jgi:hypothetical protein
MWGRFAAIPKEPKFFAAFLAAALFIAYNRPSHLLMLHFLEWANPLQKGHFIRLD